MSSQGQAITVNPGLYPGGGMVSQKNLFQKSKDVNISIEEVGNGFVIKAWKTHISTEPICRICPKDEDLLEEIAKILLELKLTTRE